MVKIHAEVGGYKWGEGEGIHRNWMARNIISISVIRVQTVFQTVAKVLTSRGGGVVPNLDPFGQTENGGGGAKIGHFSWMS